MTYYLLANPHAGHGRGQQITDTLISHLQQKQLGFHLFKTEHPLDEPRLIAQILAQKSDEDHLVIIGGDGTISLAVNALPADQPFTYIPAGSGNDFARALGIPLNKPIETFEQSLTALPKTIYVLTYSSEQLSGIAMNNLGIGLDAAIVDAANHSLIKNFLNRLRLGQLAYLVSALGVLFSKKPFTIVANQQTFHKAFLFTLTKHAFFGGGLPIAPDASLDNDEIHIVTLERFNLLGIFALIPKMLQAAHLSNPHVSHLIDQQFQVITTSEQPVQIDGEIYHLPANQTLTLTTEKRTIFQ
ncbi:MAG: diacylglycerol kinase family lipid kinase [Streptococcaceae bacterium]|nr:diacylglycerol kinase family lipid kinase [Streptococcaceae bacterium]